MAAGTTKDFAATISAGYAVEGPAIDLGRGMHEGKLVADAVVRVPLRMMNRHGLVAGATGTGKTITLQTLAEQLSASGVAVFAADVKGDVSGLGVPAEPGGPAEKRMTELGLAFEPTAFPVEYLSLGGIGPGVPVRATVSDFGPQLLAKVLDANETQEQSLALVFHTRTRGASRCSTSPICGRFSRSSSRMPGRASWRASAAWPPRRWACC
jgi:uncharacterized protein